MRILSVREHPACADRAVAYLHACWPSVPLKIYDDSITHCIGAPAPLPQWYLLHKGEETVGCAGLITNDFISRMDLYPWLCALYIEPEHRGNAYAHILIKRAQRDAAAAGFSHLYLSTDHIGYYERYGFAYLGDGYHPWGESSRIYGIGLQ